VVAILLIAGAQVPVIPFVEVVGKAGIAAPGQYGPTAAKVGVTIVFITTVVVSGGLLTPSTVITNEYTPAFASVTLGIIGFIKFDVNPFGPVQLYDAPATG
jgi:hypothetical protein